MQSFGAHVSAEVIITFGGTSAGFSESGSDQAALLVFCLSLLHLLLHCRCLLFEPEVIYCTLVFLLAAAIRHRGSDRLKLEVRSVHVRARAHCREQSASVIGGHYQKS